MVHDSGGHAHSVRVLQFHQRQRSKRNVWGALTGMLVQERRGGPSALADGPTPPAAESLVRTTSVVQVRVLRNND